MRKFCKEISLLVQNPELSKEWDYEKNYPLRPENVFANSHKKVWWTCTKGHNYNAVIQSRNDAGNNCPYCSGHKVCRDNCLATLNPILAGEWYQIKNNNITPHDVTCGSKKSVWWKCSKGHIWEAAIKTRTQGHGCACCAGLKLHIGNCLATINPELASEWHPTKNGNVTPFDITAHSNKKAYWICKSGHSYLSTIANRSVGNGCPYCSGLFACESNCLSTLNPELAKEWHPTKNGNLTARDFTSGSNKKVWWVCKNGHEWMAQINSRIGSGSGCPFCNKIELKNGTICDSLVEAHYYLKLKNEGTSFDCHAKIGLGRSNCDFYIPGENKYIEVTSFTKRWKYWRTYLKKIAIKKKHVVQKLNANFEFVQLELLPEQIQYVRENSI